jgi:hypothetical protein
VHELPPVEKLDTLPMEKTEPANEAPADVIETSASEANVHPEANTVVVSNEAQAEAGDRQPVEPDGSH